MLKRPRLLILSGQSGAGTSSAAQAMRRGLAGLSEASVVDGGCAKRMHLEALVDRAAQSAGVGHLSLELTQGLMRIDGLAGAVAAIEAAEHEETTVWDAGEIDAFLRLLSVLGTSRAALAQCISPVSAMRAMRTLQAGDVIEWQRVIDSLEAAQALIGGEDVRMFFVVEPDNGVEDVLTMRLGQLGLMRFACDGVIVNRVPAAGDGWPEPWAEARRRRVDRIRAMGVPVAVVPFLLDDAQSATAFESAAAGLLSTEQAPRPLPDRIDERGDGGYVLHVHLPGVGGGDVRAGRIADSLVIEVGGVRRQALLAPVLCRCEIQGAGMRDGWLNVRFGRNEALWPEAS